MDSYIKDFLNIIRNCSVDNTYKMAWGKALVEIATQNPEENTISLAEIARKVFKYYWNQTIYFDLVQGSNLSKPPEFITKVKKAIENYYNSIGARQPLLFDRAESSIDIPVIPLVGILKQDVSWRFLNLQSQVINLYDYKRNEDFLVLPETHLISEYSDVLFEAINFRWTQILENFNSAPRIAKKVRVLDLPEVKRTSLTKFRPYLTVENQNFKCFLCDEEITSETPAIDHVIPWSFLFSDDLWNLVYTHQRCNSQKSKIIPTAKQIGILEERNKNMLKLLRDNPGLKDKKPIAELELAIQRDFVRKFWINCKN